MKFKFVAVYCFVGDYGGGMEFVDLNNIKKLKVLQDCSDYEFLGVFKFEQNFIDGIRLLEEENINFHTCYVE